MTKYEINAKLTRLAGKDLCTGKHCKTKNIDYTRSFDACVDLLDVLGYYVLTCRQDKEGWFWSIGTGDGIYTFKDRYPVYALANAIAQTEE